MPKKLIIAFIFVWVFAYQSRAFAEKELLIGLIPEENIFRQVDRHRPLAGYLSEKLGIHVRFTILSKYGDIIDRFVSRKLDGAFFGVFTAVLAYQKLDVEPIARPVNLDGTTTAEAYVFVRKDSGINSIKDMRGKRAAFVDKATATGYIFMLSLLRENGVKDMNGFFNEYYFTGSHDSVVHTVLDGRADVGSAKSRIFKKMLEKDPMLREELVILAKSAELPDTTLCLRSDLPPELKTLVRNTLVNMHREAAGRKVLKELGALKFVEASKRDFKPVIELAGRAGINIKDYKYR